MSSAFWRGTSPAGPDGFRRASVDVLAVHLLVFGVARLLDIDNANTNGPLDDAPQRTVVNDMQAPVRGTPMNEFAKMRHRKLLSLLLERDDRHTEV
jgi:hypothetical protein